MGTQTKHLPKLPVGDFILFCDSEDFYWGKRTKGAFCFFAGISMYCEASWLNTPMYDDDHAALSYLLSCRTMSNFYKKYTDLAKSLHLATSEIGIEAEENKKLLVSQQSKANGGTQQQSYYGRYE